MSTIKPRKGSLVDFIERFSCDKCDCYDYYLVKRKNVKSGYLLVC